LLNQNPQQITRDKIDIALLQCVWVIQNKNQIYLNAGIGVGVRIYQKEIGPSDYVLFVDKNPVGII
jgi:type I restriction enzyme R subunit